MENANSLQSIIEFLGHTEKLISTLRTAWSSNGRQESTAEHTWRLCLLVMLFEKQYPEIDHHRLLKICIIHDLAEAVTGDISATVQSQFPDKSQREKQAMQKLVAPLDGKMQDEMLAIWQEYEDGSSQEAQLAKAFDKLETILQHTQGQNPDDFDFAFNLQYGKSYTDKDKMTRLFRTPVDDKTLDIIDEKNKREL